MSLVEFQLKNHRELEACFWNCETTLLKTLILLKDSYIYISSRYLALSWTPHLFNCLLRIYVWFSTRDHIYILCSKLNSWFFHVTFFSYIVPCLSKRSLHSSFVRENHESILDFFLFHASCIIHHRIMLVLLENISWL